MGNKKSLENFSVCMWHETMGQSKKITDLIEVFSKSSLAWPFHVVSQLLKPRVSYCNHLKYLSKT